MWAELPRVWAGLLCVWAGLQRWWIQDRPALMVDDVLPGTSCLCDCSFSLTVCWEVFKIKARVHAAFAKLIVFVLPKVCGQSEGLIHINISRAVHIHLSILRCGRLHTDVISAAPKCPHTFGTSPSFGLAASA